MCRLFTVATNKNSLSYRLLYTNATQTRSYCSISRCSATEISWWAQCLVCKNLYLSLKMLFLVHSMGLLLHNAHHMPHRLISDVTCPLLLHIARLFGTPFDRINIYIMAFLFKIANTKQIERNSTIRFVNECVAELCAVFSGDFVIFFSTETHLFIICQRTRELVIHLFN